MEQTWLPWPPPPRAEGKGDLKMPPKRNYFSKQIPVHLLNILQFHFLAHCVGARVFGLQKKSLGTSSLVWAVGIHLGPAPWLAHSPGISGRHRTGMIW